MRERIRNWSAPFSLEKGSGPQKWLLSHRETEPVDGPAAIRGPKFVQFLFGGDCAPLTAKLGPGLEQGDKKAINYCPGSPAFYGMNDLEPRQI